MRISKYMTKTLTGTISLGVVLSTMTACGSAGPGDGDAFLSLVGDRNVYLDNGERYDFQVRYHDKNDEPLAGVVNFAIDGDAGGASLVSSSATTNSNGVATVTLEASARGQANFYLEASAPEAGIATFSVTIEEPNEPLEPNGVYEVQSTLDLVSGLEEGQVRDIALPVLAFANDPAEGLVDLIIQLCGDRFSFCEQIEDNRSIVIAAIDTAIKQYAPELVQNIIEHGGNFAHVVQNFQVVSELSISGTGSSHRADHLLTGVDLVYGNEKIAVTLGEMGLDNIEAKSVPFAMSSDESEIELGEHAMPMTYGALLKIALERVIIANVSVHDNIPDFIEELVDCTAIGAAIDEQLNVSFGEDACSLLVGVGSRQLVNLLEGLDDTGVEIVVSGTAEPFDTNGDDKSDILRNGRWEGVIEYGGAVSATLDRDDNTFEGQRIDN